MNAPTQNLVPVEPAHPKVAGLSTGTVMAIVPQTFEDVWRMAQIVAKSGLAPYGMRTAEQISIAILTGLEIGVKPMQAIQGIAVINGRPAIWGDLAIAVVRASGLVEYIRESFEGTPPTNWAKPEGDALNYKAVCKVKRKGEPEEVYSEFSISDAITAQLWQKRGGQNGDKDTPWVTSPKRMLKMRARGFGLRDTFPDVLKGLYLAEELEGVEDAEFIEVRQSNLPTPIEPPSSETVIDVPAEAVVAPTEAAGHQGVEEKPAQPPQQSSTPTPPPEQPEPPADEPFDWETVKDEIDTQLKAAADPKHIEEIRELFAEDVERMMRSQRSVIESLFLDAERRLQQGNDSVPTATPQTPATDTDAPSSSQPEDGGSTSPDPFDPESYKTEDKELIRDMVAEAVKLAQADGGKEIVTRLYNMFVATKQIRQKAIDLKTRNAFLDVVAPLFEKHGL